MSKLLHDAAERAVRYLQGLDVRGVAPSPDSIAALSALDEPLPAGPSDPGETLRKLDEIVSPATMAMAGSRFFGFVIGGSLPAALAANWLAGAWDQNAVLYRPTPGVSHMEMVALRWLVELFGLPAASAGAFVTGATVANLTALAAARHAVLDRVGWNVEARGLFGAPPIEIIAGAEVHPSVTKSLGVLGLGRSRITLVPVDNQGRMRADRLPAMSGPTILILQAGNVNTGACDSFPEILPAARAAGAWVHVDGAFGLWAAASSKYAPIVRGIETADSWATDAHKWLNVPYDCGLAFVRDAHALRAAMAVTAEYLPTETPQRNPSDFTPELSRRARGVEVWAALHSLGRSGVAELIERNSRCAKAIADRLAAAGFEILNDVVLNQVLVSFGPPEVTQKVIEAIQDEGTCWAGITKWQGRTAMRISVSSWATTDEDAGRSAEVMVKTAKRIVTSAS
ncbi:MAG TPA: pyridoxal-dependent decarboxylase [Opitutaceae bacterium]